MIAISLKGSLLIARSPIFQTSIWTLVVNKLNKNLGNKALGDGNEIS